MGCCNSQQKFIEKEDMNIVIKRMIDQGQKSGFSDFIHKNPELKIDDEFLFSKTLKLNPLGYTLFIGRVDMFKYIYSSLEAHIAKMEDSFNKQGYRSIDILCIQGHLTMLKFYLPVYISLIIERPLFESSECDDTLCLESNPSKLINESYEHTPIQHACISCNFRVIQYIVEYFKNKPIPYIFDIDYQDEIEGQNCALLSCKLGVFKLMKFLHEQCKANFHVKNKRDENAILILSAASNKIQSYDYYICMKYLLEVIKVDPTYKHEEIVLVINNYKLLELYYKALAPYNIFPNKEQLERMNHIRVFSIAESHFSESYNQNENSKISMISSIKYENSTPNQFSLFSM
ncbi:hypothetical protein SteCoe_23068 [Stentor coeruleus]|uniref:DUF3447 domain-containing protein n=1 Tax=Stentor coeruleus TaxID=5963 RepID=A0A1R2BKS7_9CILI|nr:hypothetical protein SteCoe_23068 [Stentor coeruleus]